MYDPRQILAQLELTDAEIDVYLAMLSRARSARDIVASTNRTRATVYYALSALERRGLLAKTGREQDNLYRLEPLKRVMTLARQKQASVEGLHDKADEFIRTFSPSRRADSRPSVTLYEGSNAVGSVIVETAYARAGKVAVLAPSRSYLFQERQDILQRYCEMLGILNVEVRFLVAQTLEAGDITEIGGVSDVRCLPGGLADRFQMTSIIYDDCVLSVSAIASGYGWRIVSPEESQMMLELYDVLWGQSKAK